MIKNRLFGYAIFSALICLCLTACINTPQPTSYTIYLTRHFEKVSDVPDPDLTAKGQKQAEIFVSLLDNKPITAIYSTNYKRTMQSAIPLANTLNLTVQNYDPRTPEAIIAKVTNEQTAQVIVGHSNTIPDLVRRLGGQAQDLAESDYGLVFAVTITLLEGQRIKTETRKMLLLDKVTG